MLKKLQNLLFEDEEDDEEEEFEEEETVEPVKPVKTAKTAAQPQRNETPAVPQKTTEPVHTERPVYTEPVQQQPAAPQKTMQRIDVTQPLPVVDGNYGTRTQQPAKSVFAEETKTAPKTQLGITADAPVSRPAQTVRKPETKTAAAPVKAAAKTAAPAAKTAKAAKPKSSYNFQPVISPIFGVDEKDMNSLKTTTNRINAKEQASRKEGSVSPIISPMYGSNTEESIIAPKGTRKETGSVSAAIEERAAADDILPEFSLDDILATGDEKFAEEQRSAAEEAAPLFPDLDFDDDEETADSAASKVSK